MARDQEYYEAEKKIEQTLKSGATEIDLRSHPRNEQTSGIHVGA
jgi:hypothetical protein